MPHGDSRLIQFSKNSPIGFTAAGVFSAVISVNFPNYMLIGATFGAAIVLYLALFEGIRTPFRFAAFLFACVASFPLSILGVFVLGLRMSQSMNMSLFDLFVGGGTGAFVVLLSGMLLFGPAEMRGDTLGLAFFGAVGGGILGLLGGVLDRAIGSHGAGDFGASVYFVWQSGIALILGLLLRWGQKRYLAVPQTPQ
jgi:hypothetical protein